MRGSWARRSRANPTVVVATRASRSRPGAGIVTFRHEMTNQRGEVALSMTRTVLLRGGAKSD